MKIKENKITEEDVRRPISDFVEQGRREVEIWDMADYYDIFFAIERTILYVWEDKAALKDKNVLSAYRNLIHDFDNQKEGSLASEISKGIKAMLLYRKFNGRGDYTYGEIVSCLKFLIKIAKQHKSPSGRGYLRWIKTFFEGNLPVTEGEILEYIAKNES